MPATAASEAKRRARELEAQAKRLREKTARSAPKLKLRLVQSIRKKTRGGRATRGQGSFIKRGKVQTLNFKTFAGAVLGDKYGEKKAKKAESFTNMLGKTAKERLEEFELDFARHPRVARHRLVQHIALSLPAGRKASPEEWRRIVELWLKKIGAEGCNYSAHIHDDTDNQHLHVIYSRARPDGSLVSLAWDYLRHREAAANVADALLGGRETPRPVPSGPTPSSDRHEAALRRARRRGTQPGYIDQDGVLAALERARTAEEFGQALQARGIDLRVSKREDGTVRGLLLRRQGSQEWLAASSISRQLSLPRVQARLAQNAAVFETPAAAALRQQAHAKAIARARAGHPTSSPTPDRPRGG